MVLAGEIDLGAEVRCTGSYRITATDVDNLERKSSASVTAEDEYETEVAADAAVTVVLDQVRDATVLVRLDDPPTSRRARSCCWRL